MSAWLKLTVLTVGALLAAALPTWIVSTTPPSATFYNQAAAMVGWGVWACLLVLMILDEPGISHPHPRKHDPGQRSLWLTLLCLALATGWSTWRMALPTSLMFSVCGLLAAAALTLWLGQTVVRAGWARQAFTAFCLALVIGGLVNTAVALVQVFAPQLTDSVWIASTSAAIAGRAAGNVRQPNHLSSLLLWSLAALVWLQAAMATQAHRSATLKQTSQAILTMLGLLLCGGLVLTGSRTGTIGVLILAAWGGLDRRLPWNLRGPLLGLPVAYGLLGWAWNHWLHAHLANAEIDGRFNLQGDISASRFGIWSNAWDLLMQHPWTGVGWGGFNFAWSLTPFEGRPTAFFDHIHNLPLHFAVELGLPLALLVCAGLSHALWRAWRAGRKTAGLEGTMVTTAAVMLLMVALHSQLEYPLWYAYFLLPTGFLWGLCLASSSAEPGAEPRPVTAASPERSLVAVLVGGVLLTTGGCFATLDYQRVVAIFAPPAHAGPLSDRIEAGQRSVFFAHHAHYAAANETEASPERVLLAVNVAAHNLLDTRLMTSWAQALAEEGDLDRARYLAQRLREFGHSRNFFEGCGEDKPQGDPSLPFQCVPPLRELRFEDFLPQ